MSGKDGQDERDDGSDGSEVALGSVVGGKSPSSMSSGLRCTEH